MDKIRSDNDYSKEGGPSLDWHSVHERLGRLRSDVLYLFDCCCAASSISLSDNNSGEEDEAESGVVDVMPACGFGSSTPGSGPVSFTNALTVALNSLSSNSKKPTISIPALHRQVSRTLHEVYKQKEGSPTTPILFRLHGSDDRPCISLELAKPTKETGQKTAARCRPENKAPARRVVRMSPDLSDMNDLDIDYVLSIPDEDFSELEGLHRQIRPTDRAKKDI